MAAAEESAITYQQLSDLEREFDDVETEISEFIHSRFSTKLNRCATTRPRLGSSSYVAM
jgi:hypothetical protein